MLAKVIYLCSFLLIFACNSTKNMNDSETSSESDSVQMTEDGYSKATIMANRSSEGCPYIMEVEGLSYKIDPINLDASYKKDAMKVWIKFTGLRMANRCEDANPVRIDEIQTR